MTREERLDLLKQIEKDIYVPSIESTFLDDAKSCAIHSAIEELEQEPKTGYWEWLRCDMYVCSECKNVYTDLSGIKDGMNYCPNCGSRNEVKE